MLDNLGDTLPLIEIADKYEKIGGNVVFFSEGGYYKKLVKNNEKKIKDKGFKLVRIKIKNIEDRQVVEQLHRKSSNYHKGKTSPEDAYIDIFNKSNRSLFKKIIEQESEVFKKEKIDLLLTGFQLQSRISTYLAKIPIVFLVSGTVTPAYYESQLATFPINFENFLTGIIPKNVKNYFINWYLLKTKKCVKDYNKLAEDFGAPKVKRFLDIINGDYTLIPEDINFLNIKPSSKFSLNNFLGPILYENNFCKLKNKEDFELKKHFKKPGKKILITLGSSGARWVFIEILKALNDTEYIVVAVHSSILEKCKETLNFSKNILLRESVPSIKEMHKKADLSIIHGGRGTVYTAALAGKPIIGIPMHLEQQYNIDNIIRKGAGIRIGKKNFSRKKLINSIECIFKDYKKYIKYAERLKKDIRKPDGAKNASLRIIEILNEINDIKKKNI